MKAALVTKGLHSTVIHDFAKRFQFISEVADCSGVLINRTSANFGGKRSIGLKLGSAGLDEGKAAPDMCLQVTTDEIGHTQASDRLGKHDLGKLATPEAIDDRVRHVDKVSRYIDCSPIAIEHSHLLNHRPV